MNRTSLVGIALSCLSIFGSATPPVLAQIPTSVNRQVANKLSMIPKSTAISIAFRGDTIFTKDMKEDYFTTELVEPILDSNSNAVAQVKSLVNTRLKRVKGGAEISVKSVVIGGREVPVQTSSLFISDKTIDEIRAEQKGKLHGQIGKAFGTLVGGTVGTKTETIEKMASGGALAGLVFGFKKEKKQAVIIPKDTTYTVSLESSVVLNTPVNSPTAVKSSQTRLTETLKKAKYKTNTSGR